MSLTISSSVLLKKRCRIWKE